MVKLAKLGQFWDIFYQLTKMAFDEIALLHMLTLVTKNDQYFYLILGKEIGTQ